MEKRVYEAWKGSNKFILGGRLIFGPDARSLPSNFGCSGFIYYLFIDSPLPNFSSGSLDHATRQRYRQMEDKTPTVQIPRTKRSHGQWCFRQMETRQPKRISTTEQTAEINVYNRGCPSNFLEIFCFRAFIPPRVISLPTARETAAEADGDEEEEEEGGTRRQKVEDDLDIGEDLLRISWLRCDPEEVVVNEEVPHHVVDMDQSILGSGRRASAIRSEARHGSWDLASDLPPNSTVTEAATKEGR